MEGLGNPVELGVIQNDFERDPDLLTIQSEELKHARLHMLFELPQLFGLLTGRAKVGVPFFWIYVLGVTLAALPL